jgi:hypothetical protein
MFSLCCRISSSVPSNAGVGKEKELAKENFEASLDCCGGDDEEMGIAVTVTVSSTYGDGGSLNSFVVKFMLVLEINFSQKIDT